MYLCPMKGCPEVYQYKKTFESHLGKIHFVIDTMEIESLCLKAQTLEVDHEEEDDEIMYHELELLCELQTNGQ
jgi:hypothetical protein